jgi:hypothetical protein
MNPFDVVKITRDDSGFFFGMNRSGPTGIYKPVPTEKLQEINAGIWPWLLGPE